MFSIVIGIFLTYYITSIHVTTSSLLTVDPNQTFSSLTTRRSSSSFIPTDENDHHHPCPVIEVEHCFSLSNLKSESSAAVALQNSAQRSWKKDGGYIDCLGLSLPYSNVTFDLLPRKHFKRRVYEIRSELRKWSALRVLPKCWVSLRPLLCSIYFAPCGYHHQSVVGELRDESRLNDTAAAGPSGVTYFVNLISVHYCRIIREHGACDLLPKFYGDIWPDFLNCSNDGIYAQSPQLEYHSPSCFRRPRGQEERLQDFIDDIMPPKYLNNSHHHRNSLISSSPINGKQYSPMCLSPYLTPIASTSSLLGGQPSPRSSSSVNQFHLIEGCALTCHFFSTTSTFHLNDNGPANSATSGRHRWNSLYYENRSFVSRQLKNICGWLGLAFLFAFSTHILGRWQGRCTLLRLPSTLVLMMEGCWLAALSVLSVQFWGGGVGMTSEGTPFYCNESDGTHVHHNDDQVSPICSLSTFILYFTFSAHLTLFTMLTCAWFILSSTKPVTTYSKKSPSSPSKKPSNHDILDEKSTKFYMTCLIIPFVSSVSVILLDLSEGDSLLGTCFVYSLTSMDDKRRFSSVKLASICVPIVACILISFSFNVKTFSVLHTLVHTNPATALESHSDEETASRKRRRAKKVSQIKGQMGRMLTFVIIFYSVCLYLIYFILNHHLSIPQLNESALNFIVCEARARSASNLDGFIPECEMERRPSLTNISLLLLSVVFAALAVLSWSIHSSTVDIWKCTLRDTVATLRSIVVERKLWGFCFVKGGEDDIMEKHRPPPSSSLTAIQGYNGGIQCVHENGANSGQNTKHPLSLSLPSLLPMSRQNCVTPSVNVLSASICSSTSAVGHDRSGPQNDALRLHRLDKYRHRQSMLSLDSMLSSVNDNKSIISHLSFVSSASGVALSTTRRRANLSDRHLPRNFPLTTGSRYQSSVTTDDEERVVSRYHGDDNPVNRSDVVAVDRDRKSKTKFFNKFSSYHKQRRKRSKLVERAVNHGQKFKPHHSSNSSLSLSSFSSSISNISSNFINKQKSDFRLPVDSAGGGDVTSLNSNTSTDTRKIYKFLKFNESVHNPFTKFSKASITKGKNFKELRCEDPVQLTPEAQSNLSSSTSQRDVEINNNVQDLSTLNGMAETLKFKSDCVLEQHDRRRRGAVISIHD